MYFSEYISLCALFQDESDDMQGRGEHIITEAQEAEELPESPAPSSLNDTPTPSSIKHTLIFISGNTNYICML